GVDVELRKGMWAIVDTMRERGVTIILTTHYIEEAELMADRVGIINRGKLLMVDQKDAMMARLGRTEAHITLARPLAALPPEIARFPVELEPGGEVLCYRGGDGTGKGKAEVAALTKALIAADIDYVGIDTRESSLEEIFVSLLGEGKAA
ncbi:MAG TPA: multidrug ABC transporter ATP-binding protein, partial [Erythrobacter sp.]|nr:multidrug ABC transporter ATP-binding protein [Erythrobacter sp.]